jgi:hypothetical protein
MPPMFIEAQYLLEGRSVRKPRAEAAEARAASTTDRTAEDGAQILVKSLSRYPYQPPPNPFASGLGAS